MNFVYVGDSSTDTNEEVMGFVDIKKAPLQITIDGEFFVDDGSIDIIKMLAKINLSPHVPKTAAPSPYDFMKYSLEENDGTFIVTLSSRLSGSYNSAMIAAKELKEQGKKVHVFDSKSAATAQTLILMKAKEFANMGESFEQIVLHTEEFINDLQTFFLLDDINPLMKNGRMGKLTGRLAQLLLIKPILCGNREGEILLYDKKRSYKKALDRLGEIVCETHKKTEDFDLFIDHCNCLERAEYLRDFVSQRRKFRNIYITHSAGLSSVYEAQGGVICTF